MPRYAGVLSALGMLLADTVKDYALTVLRAGQAIDMGELAALFAPLVAEAERDLAQEGFGPDRLLVERRLEVRYAGQSYELAVPLTVDFRAAFDRRHERTYGYANPRRPIEVVTLRVVAVGVTDKPALPRLDAPPRPAEPYRVRDARFGGASVPTAFHRWSDLTAGAEGDGPAVIAGGEATAVIPPGFRFRIDPFANLVATRGPRG